MATCPDYHGSPTVGNQPRGLADSGDYCAGFDRLSVVMEIMFEPGRKHRMIFFLGLFIGVIVVLFMVDVPASVLLAAPRMAALLPLQDTSGHTALEGTRKAGYPGNRSRCPEKIHDMVSNGAPVEAMGTLDHIIPRLLKRNFSTVGHMEQCRTRD